MASFSPTAPARSLTVGQMRRLLEGLPDDAPVLVAEDGRHPADAFRGADLAAPFGPGPAVVVCRLRGEPVKHRRYEDPKVWD